MASSFSRCNRNIVFAVLVACTAACSSPESPTASLVVTAAPVWTGDPGRPRAEAVAESGEGVLAVGIAGDVAPLIGSDTAVIESDGGRWAGVVIGADRAKTTHAFRSLIDHDLTASVGREMRFTEIMHSLVSFRRFSRGRASAEAPDMAAPTAQELE